MVSVVDAVAAFITRYALELAAGLAILLLLISLVLLIILIRRKPEDVIAKLHDIIIGLANKQERLENVVKDEYNQQDQDTKQKQDCKPNYQF